jgi:ribosomal protein S12 methylthiotransferase accessory factor
VAIDRTHPGRYWQSSDGLASGNTREEAVLHGMLERIERDADVLFRLAKPAIRAKACFDPRVLACPSVDRLLSLISAAGFAVVTLDITSDVGVPSVLAYLYPLSGKTSGLRYIDVTLGSGTHFSAARATVRALTEAVQSRLTLISGARDDVEPSLFSAPLHPVIAADLALAPTARPPRDIEVAGRTMSERIALLLSMLGERRVGRVLAVDLAPGEKRFSVVKLLIPELESPDGNRRRRFGARALPKMMVF